MLCEMYEYAKDYVGILYAEYEDGIVEGLYVKEDTDQKAVLTKGLVKYSGRIYRMADDFLLSEYVAERVAQGEIKGGTEYKLMLTPEKQLEELEQAASPVPVSMRKHMMQFTIVPKSASVEGIFLASFILDGNNEIALFYADDTKHIVKAKLWNMTECPYVLKNSVTYHPYIFSIIKKQIMDKHKKTELDYLMLSQLTMHKVLDYEFMLTILEDYGKNVEKENRSQVLAEFVTWIDEQKVEIAEESENKNNREFEEGKMLE